MLDRDHALVNTDLVRPPSSLLPFPKSPLSGGLLNNLIYLFWVWAHEAKRFNSFAAAKHYLRAISLINVRKTRAVPNFKPEDIDVLIEYMLDGAEELRLAADYSRLQDWETFREKQSRIFNASLPEFETCGKKGGK